MTQRALLLLALAVGCSHPVISDSDTGTDAYVTPGNDAGPHDAGACSAPQISCGMPPTCVNPLTSNTHCGRCNNACPSGQQCMGGACILPCTSPERACGSGAMQACRNTQTDAMNCGVCGTACQSRTAAIGVCAMGHCGIMCQPDRGDCDGSIESGCETIISSDPNHCGRCGNVCLTPANATRMCSRGTCAFSCTTGFFDCNAMASDGCEAMLATDLANCGACGTACMTRPNSTRTCTGGTCGFACDMGSADCDRMPGNGCEVTLATDRMNCGACGTACRSELNAAAPCAGGTCGALACSAGFLDCNGDLGTGGNGCEFAGATCPRIQWRYTWGGANDDVPLFAGRVMDVATDSAGNIYALGTYARDITVSGTVYTSPGPGGVVIALGPTGTFRWSRNIATIGSGGAVPWDIAVDGIGDVYVAGFGSGGNLAVDGVSVGVQNGTSTAFVVKLQRTLGATSWGRTFPMTFSDADGIAFDSTGRVLVTGGFTGTQTMDAFMLMSAGLRDGFVATFNPATGAVVSAYRYGGPAEERPYAVAALPGDEVVVVGQFFGGTAVFGTFTVPNAGGSDGYYARFNATGTAVGAGGANGPGTDILSDVTAGPSGNYYVAGSSGGTVTVGGRMLTSGTGAILARISAAGATPNTAAWVTGQTAGGSTSDGITHIVVDATETVRFAYSATGSATAMLAGMPLRAGGSARLVSVDGITGAATRIDTFGGATFYANSLALGPFGRGAVVGYFAPTQTVDGLMFTSAGLSDQYVMLLGP